MRRELLILCEKLYKYIYKRFAAMYDKTIRISEPKGAGI